MAPKSASSFARRWDSWSYKRVKDSLVTEIHDPSCLGATLSVFGGLIVALLLLLETAAFMTVSLRQETVMAPETQEPLRVTFNVSFPLTACNLLSVDYMDVLGRRQLNLTKNVYKFRLDGQRGQRLMAVADTGRAATQYADQLEGNFRPEGDGVNDVGGKTLLLTQDSFEAVVKAHEVVLVAYGAPWCPWSKRLAPVLDEVAGIIGNNEAVRIARVDCTDPVAVFLCMTAHIQAYPTIALYKGGSTHSDIHFHAERSAQNLLSFLVLAQQDEALGHESDGGEGQGGPHGMLDHAHAEALQRELGLLQGEPGGADNGAGAGEGRGHAHGGGSGSGSGGEGGSAAPAPARDPADPGKAVALIEAMHRAGLAAPGDVARAAVQAALALVGQGGNGTGGNGTGAAGAPPGECKEDADGGRDPALLAGLGPGGGAAAGCQIAGYIEVARVPGSIVIGPPGSGVSLVGPLNLTHAVHELVFSSGPPNGPGRLTPYQLGRLPAGTRGELHRQAGGVYVSTSAGATHEHFLQVVRSSFTFGTGHAAEGFRYSVASHQFVAAAEEPGTGSAAPPHVRWGFSLSPLSLAVSEHRKPLYKFVIDLMAIVAGAFAVMGALDTVLHGAVRTLVKRELGKQL